MRVYNQKIANDVALNANSNGVAVELKNVFMYAITATITGTPTGTLKLQASSDPLTDTTIPLTNSQPTNWVDITDSSFTVTSAGNSMWNVRDVAYNWVRVVYTDASGGASTATMDIVVNCKGT